VHTHPDRVSRRRRQVDAARAALVGPQPESASRGADDRRGPISGRRGITLVAPYRQFGGKAPAKAQATLDFDEHGTAFCRHCKGGTNQVDFFVKPPKSRNGAPRPVCPADSRLHRWRPDPPSGPHPAPCSSGG
jgi:hypothetical protein